MYGDLISANYDGYLTISINEDKFDLSRDIYTSGFVGLYRTYGMDSVGSEMFYTLAQKYGMNPEVSKEDFARFVLKLSTLGAFHEKNKRYAFTTDDMEKYGSYSVNLGQIESTKEFFTIYSLVTLIFLKLSDIKVETFDSVRSDKNRPTELIDSNTGKRNQGVIIVNKLYNVEIKIDAPFSVKGHWRNQYCGKDSEGNPIHKQIFIEAFEKSGYHRRATKDIIDIEK